MAPDHGSEPFRPGGELLYLRPNGHEHERSRLSLDGLALYGLVNGVSLRAVTTSPDTTGLLDDADLRRMLQCGATVREASVPLIALVVNRASVILEDPHDAGGRVRPSSDPKKVQWTIDLFVATWKSARPLGGSVNVDGRGGEILRRLGRGETNAKIARELHISERTLARELEALERKLGATDRFQLAVRASRLGLLGDS